MAKKSPFSVSEADHSPGFLLWQVSMIWQRKIAAALKPLAITHPQFVLLASLLWLSKKEDQVTQVMLSKHTKIDVMTVSQVIRLLEEKEFLIREPHPVDTRAKILKLTKKGEACAIKAVPAVEGADHDFFESLGSGNSKFIPYLQKLIQQNEMETPHVDKNL